MKEKDRAKKGSKHQEEDSLKGLFKEIRSEATTSSEFQEISKEEMAEGLTPNKKKNKKEKDYRK